MKKVLSLTLALVMLVATVSATFSAQAAYPFIAPDTVTSVKEKAAAYIAENDTSDFTDAANSSLLWTLMKAGRDMSAVKDGFAADVKAKLDANEGAGKLILTGTDWSGNPTTYEDVAAYAAVPLVLDAFGYDVENFEGYNLLTVFENYDLSGVTNPYSYRVAVEAANRFNMGDFAETLLADMESRYYVMGSGLDYWGFSCDNTAQMLLAIGNRDYPQEHAAIIADAKNVLEAFTVRGTDLDGAFADSTYVTTVNADSTALAMGGLAAVGDVVQAKWYYTQLLANFRNSQTGAFTAYGSDDLYATKDALIGLIYFEHAVKYVHDFDDTQCYIPAAFGSSGVATAYCSVCGTSQRIVVSALKPATLKTVQYVYDGKAKTPAFTVTDTKGTAIAGQYYDVTYQNNKVVGTASATLKMKGLYTGSVTKTFVINPKGTTVSKLTAAKAGFTAAWKKQATQTTGYQVQYATNQNFKNAKTVTVKTNKTVSKKFTKLAKGKKYFVRVRTYKTVNGKKYYSAWSAAKSVTTKK